MSKNTSSFFANVLKLVSGNIFSQGLGVLVAPIITRLFAPEAFGTAALYSSIAGLIGAVVCLKYELSIMLPESDEDAVNLLALCLCSVLIVTVFSSIFIWAAKDRIVLLLNATGLAKCMWLIPITVLISGIYLSLNTWCSRFKRFGQISIANFASSTVTQTSKLGFGFFECSTGGALILATILGRLFSTFILVGQIWRKEHKLLKGSIKWERIAAGLKKFRKFPMFSLWSALLNTSSHQLPAWILAYYFSAKVVGNFALASTVLSLPMSIVGQSIAKVFFQKASQAYNRPGELPMIVEEVFKRLVCIGFFPILMLTLIGEDVFIFVFGTQWTEAGVYVQFIGLLIFLRFISSPVSTLFSVIERQGSGLIINLILFVSWSLSLIVGGMSGNVRFALFLYTLSGVLIYGSFCLWLMISVRVPTTHVVNIILKYVIYSSPMLIVIYLAKWFFNINESGILFVGLISAIVYYALVIMKDEELKEKVHMLFSRLVFIK